MKIDMMDMLYALSLALDAVEKEAIKGAKPGHGKRVGYLCYLMGKKAGMEVALTKEEAAEYSHIGLNKLEEMLKVPNCPFVLYVGKKKLVKRKAFEEFISEQVEL